MLMGACVRSTLNTRKSRRTSAPRAAVRADCHSACVVFSEAMLRELKEKNQSSIVGRKFMQNCTIVFAAILSTEDYLYARFSAQRFISAAFQCVYVYTIVCILFCADASHRLGRRLLGKHAKRRFRRIEWILFVIPHSIFCVLRSKKEKWWAALLFRSFGSLH